jgi:hypothetical protein
VLKEQQMHFAKLVCIQEHNLGTQTLWKLLMEY